MGTQTPEYVHDYIESLVTRSRAAQKQFERNYNTQRAVDEVVRAAGKAVYDNARLLAEEAVAETGMGDLEGKMMKAQGVTLRNWNFMKGKPSVGVVDDFSEPGIRIIAKPVGVVGAVMPSTNPIATVAGNAMMALKGRNSIIIAAHPASARGSIHTTNIIREALKKIGAPEDLVLCIEEPSIAMTTELLHQVDVNVATGGAAMVKAVYSAGHPAFGVGQGNCQDIFDLDYPDFSLPAKMIVANRSSDRGVPCTGDQTVIVPAAREREMVVALQAAGAYIVEDQETIDRIRDTVFPTEAINRAVVGKSPAELGKLFGIDVPEDAKVICFKVNARGREDKLCKEILCPILRYTTYETFEEAVDIAVANLNYEGAGHSSAIWSKHQDHIDYAANLIPVGRFHVEQPTLGINNAIAPPITIGCGSWGNNSISENLQYYHLLNVTRVTTQLPEPIFHTPEDWDNYEIRTEWGTKVRY